MVLVNRAILTKPTGSVVGLPKYITIVWNDPDIEIYVYGELQHTYTPFLPAIETGNPIGLLLALTYNLE